MENKLAYGLIAGTAIVGLTIGSALRFNSSKYLDTVTSQNTSLTQQVQALETEKSDLSDKLKEAQNTETMQGKGFKLTKSKLHLNGKYQPTIRTELEINKDKIHLAWVYDPKSPTKLKLLDISKAKETTSTEKTIDITTGKTTEEKTTVETIGVMPYSIIQQEVYNQLVKENKENKKTINELKKTLKQTEKKLRATTKPARKKAGDGIGQ